jgi:hypothetical protein
MFIINNDNALYFAFLFICQFCLPINHYQNQALLLLLLLPGCHYWQTDFFSATMSREQSGWLANDLSKLPLLFSFPFFFFFSFFSPQLCSVCTLSRTDRPGVSLLFPLLCMHTDIQSTDVSLSTSVIVKKTIGTTGCLLFFSFLEKQRVMKAIRTFFDDLRNKKNRTHLRRKNWTYMQMFL